MNVYSFVSGIVLLTVGIVFYAIYQVVENNSTLAGFALGAFATLAVLGLGLGYGLINVWLNSKIEEKRFSANIQENMSIMASLQRVQNQQNSMLLKQHQTLVHNQPETLPAPDDALLIQDGIFDELDAE